MTVGRVCGRVCLRVKQVKLSKKGYTEIEMLLEKSIKDKYKHEMAKAKSEKWESVEHSRY